MPAPKGNQNAKGHGCGRPKEYDLDSLAQALSEWSQKDDSLNLLEFCNEQDLLAEYLSRWAKENVDFEQALKKAKQQIATRREKLVNKNAFNYGIYQRGQAMYDIFLHEHERAEKQFDADLKRKDKEADQESFVEAINEIVQRNRSRASNK